MSWRLVTAIVAALLTLGLAAGVVACGQGGKGAEAPSPVAMNEVAKGFLPFTSSSEGYSITYPESWWVQEDVGSFGGVSIDAFWAPPEDTGTPIVNVLCSPIAEGTTTEELYAVLGPEADVVGQVFLRLRTAPPTLVIAARHRDLYSSGTLVTRSRHHYADLVRHP